MNINETIKQLNSLLKASKKNKDASKELIYKYKIIDTKKHLSTLLVNAINAMMKSDRFLYEIKEKYFIYETRIDNRLIEVVVDKGTLFDDKLTINTIEINIPSSDEILIKNLLEVYKKLLCIIYKNKGEKND